MGSYSVRADETELASLVSRAEAGEEIVLSRDGLAVAKIIPFPVAKQRELRPLGLKLIEPELLDLLDKPLHEEEQRAFGMSD